MCSTALVRLIKNKELVGIFSYPTKPELFNLIDQCVDPYECEYIVIHCGGIYWPDPGVGKIEKVDLSETEEETEDEVYDNARVCDYAYYSVQHAKRWEQFNSKKMMDYFYKNLQEK
tara:strand:- start:3540 stop:3887 length:348 start_codon:yes stop_codon:yes gene_type:complete